jgi:hypothetical protein
MKSTSKMIFGIIGGLLWFVIMMVVLVISKGPGFAIGAVPPGPGYSPGEELQIFGCLLGAAVIVLSYRAVPVMFIPLERRTKGGLWFGIGWLVSLGVVPVCLFYAKLFPWQGSRASFGPFVVPIIVSVLVWCFVVCGVWRSVLELNRRSKSPTW